MCRRHRGREGGRKEGRKEGGRQEGREGGREGGRERLKGLTSHSRGAQTVGWVVAQQRRHNVLSLGRNVILLHLWPVDHQVGWWKRNLINIYTVCTAARALLAISLGSQNLERVKIPCQIVQVA